MTKLNEAEIRLQFHKLYGPRMNVMTPVLLDRHQHTLKGTGLSLLIEVSGSSPDDDHTTFGPLFGVTVLLYEHETDTAEKLGHPFSQAFGSHDEAVQHVKSLDAMYRREYFEVDDSPDAHGIS